VATGTPSLQAVPSQNPAVIMFTNLHSDRRLQVHSLQLFAGCCMSMPNERCLKLVAVWPVMAPGARRRLDRRVYRRPQAQQADIAESQLNPDIQLFTSKPAAVHNTIAFFLCNLLSRLPTQGRLVVPCPAQ
jgi:hypothetical protein